MTRTRILLMILSAIPLLGGMFLIWPRASRVVKRLHTTMTMPVYDKPITRSDNFTNLIFLHHSTGRNLIREGNVRGLFIERGFQLWDHDYNYIGLTAPNGTNTQAHYQIPGSLGGGNTDVNGLAALFVQPVTNPPKNAISRLLQHDVIIVKSCFPNSAIKSEEMSETFQAHYLQMRDVMDAHPSHLFILVTSPPLHPLVTNAAEAIRAREMANWLNSPAFLEGHANVQVFDYFDLLADPTTNMLRSEYQIDATAANSHPNQLANETIGLVFVDFVETAVFEFREQ